ncbi:N-acetyltransferase family protein [Actinosynnema sp. CA-299493]
MRTITVRPPRADDLAPLVEVYVRARRSYYDGHLPEEELAEWERSARSLGDDIFDQPGRVWLCADLDHEFAGFAQVRAGGELGLLHVAPARWGNGVGLALHDAAVDALRDLGVTTARLDVFAHNHRARRFYLARGWREVGRDESHLRMALELEV